MPPQPAMFRQRDRSQFCQGAPQAVAQGDDLQRQAWQWAVARQRSDGALPSGKAIAEIYGCHERWGRLVKSAGLAGAFGQAPVKPEPSPNGVAAGAVPGDSEDHR